MLGTPLVQSQDDPPLLNCLIEGEYVVFPVALGCDYMVGQFKEVIKSKRVLDSLKNVDAYTLELWKVSAIDEESLCEVISLFSAQGL